MDLGGLKSDAKGVYHVGCRCGDEYEFELDELEEDEEYFECNSCSLGILVRR